MYRCMPPTPSWLCGTWSIIFGMNPPTSVPVVSVMYLPTVPLAFARPFGNRDDVELSSRRAVSRALAARTTTLARTRASAPVVLSTYATPVARPLASTSTSRAIAFVRRVSFPVARAWRRLEHPVRLVREALLAAEDPDEPVDLVVVRCDVVVGDRPVVAEAVPTLALEVVRPEAQCNAAPVVGAATDHAGPPPGEVGARRARVRLAGDFPSADAGVELAERSLLRGSPAARRLVRPRQHCRVLRIVPRRTGFEHHHLRAGLGESVGGHSPAGPRADDTHVVYSGLGARGSGLGHTVQVSTACRSEVRGSRVGVNSCAMNPAKPVSAMADATACQFSSCVPSSSWRPGTPPVWKWASHSRLSRMVRMMSPSMICM